MAKNDAELIRKSLKAIEDPQSVLQEAAPMNWRKALELQLKSAFQRPGAETQLWIGNYANSIYKAWIRQSQPEDTGEDFIGWFSKSPKTGSVDIIESPFIHKIVYQATQGKLDQPLTKQQVETIAKNIATITLRQSMGLTHKLTTRSTPEQRQQALDLLQKLMPYLQQKKASGSLSLAWIAQRLHSLGQFTPANIQKAFKYFYKQLRVPLAHFTGLNSADTTKLTNDQVDSLIPILDDLILTVVILSGGTGGGRGSRDGETPPGPTPAPTADQIVDIINNLRARGLTDAEISQALNLIFRGTA